MDENEKNLKECKMCFHKIDIRAKKCPYCHHLQHAIFIFLRSPLVGVLPIVLAFLFFPWLLSTLFSEGEPFEPHRMDLIIKESEMKFGEDKCGQTVSVLGTMQNTGKFSWEDVNIEAKFFDANGKMSDSNQKKQYTVEIPAGGEAVFKFSMEREYPQEQYKTYTLKIMSAKEVGSFP